MRLGTKLMVAASFAVALTWARPALASDIVLIDPDGGGGLGTVPVNTLDWAPGNSLLMENTTANPLLVRVLFQANLSVMLDGAQPANITFTNGGNSSFWTVVAGFSEIVSGQLIGPGSTTTNFNVDPTQPNFFRICQNTTAAGNDGAGTGFACATPILSGVLQASADPLDNFSTFTGSNVATGDLDQHAGDNYAAIDSISGTGSTNLRVLVTFANSAFFRNIVVGTTIAFSTTNQSLQYVQAEPSLAFSIDGIANGGTPGATVGSIGTCNGCQASTAPNSMAQTDANTAFTGIAAIPEPATLSLLGLGLLGSAAARRRQKKAQQ